MIFGESKIDEAINFIREHEPPEGYFLGYSGGKDSEVLLHLAKASGVKFQAYYLATGIDPPEVVKHIKKNHPEVTFLRPKKSFYQDIWHHGYPMRQTRWCCNTLKKHPARQSPLKHRLLGLRAEEGKRGKMPRIQWHNKEKQWLYKPIFRWLEWEIWEYIDRNNLPYCSLYDEGFGRLGCIVCPFFCNPNPRILNMHRDRWPKQYAAFERAMKLLFDNWLCVVNPRSGGWNFKHETDFNEFLDNWYRGFTPKNKPQRQDQPRLPGF